MSGSFTERSADLEDPLNRNKEPRVTVVGSGLSGLACASTLHRRGFRVRVYDRGRQAGGRLATRLVQCRSDSEILYDHGAPMIHVRDDCFRSEAIRWIQAGAASWWQPQTLDANGESQTTEAVLVGVPTMADIPRQLAAGLDLHQSCSVSDARHSSGGWVLEIERYGEEQPFRDETDMLVLAMPLKQAKRLADLPDLFSCDTLSESESTPTWACMMTIDAGSEIETLPDLYAPDRASMLERICFEHRKPGRASSHGVVSLVAYAQSDWAAVLRDQSRESVLEVMSNSTRAVLDRLLGFNLGDRAILDARIHRWGLARPVGLLPFSHKYNHEYGIGLCSDGMGGSDAESAFLSGRALADTITASYPG